MTPSADHNNAIATGTTAMEQQKQSNGGDEAVVNINLSNAVIDLHEQLASKVDLCNNLLVQFTSIRRLSTTPYGDGGYGNRMPLVNSLTLRRLHPNWTNRLKGRLHSSISECVEDLREFSVNRLPALARKFDRAQSSTKDDVSLLVADFEFSLAVDSARPSSSIFDRYSFETDDRALVAAHLRRLAARLDAELDRLTNMVGFEIDASGGDGADAAMINNRAKMRRHSFALKGSSRAKSFLSNNSNIARMSISLEPYLMLNTDNSDMVFQVASEGGPSAAVGGIAARRTGGRLTVLPDWSVELALGRLSTGGGRFF